MSTSAPVHDYSATAMLAECARRYFYAVVQGLVPNHQSIALHTGRVLHAGLHEFYATGDVEEAVRVIHEEWGSVRAPAERSYLSAGHCEIIIRNYVEDRTRSVFEPLRIHKDEIDLTHVVSFTPSVDDEGYVVFAETPIAVTLPSSLQYAGLLDLPATVHGDIYIVDHKTTGRWLTENWAQKYARSYQLKGYVTILERILGKRVAGIFVNGIYTGKQAADPKAAWSKRTSYRNRLFGPYVFSPAELEDHENWALAWAATRQRYLVDQKITESAGKDPALAWPQNDRACDFCEFAPVCHGSPAARPSILASRYHKRDITGVLASGADSDD